MKQRIRRFDEAKSQIRPGDWMFYRCGWKPSNVYISRVSGSPRVHVGMVDVTAAHKLVILHTRQWRGAERVGLREQVERYPGRWEHFKTNPDNPRPEWDPMKAVQYIRDLIGKP